MRTQREYKPKNRYSTFIHIVAWSILFILPFIFVERFNERSPIDDGVLRFFIQPVCLVIIFYLNYLWLIDKLLFQKKTWRYLLINALLVFMGCLIVHIVHHSINHSFPQPFNEFIGNHPHPHPPQMPWQDPIILVLVVGLSVAIKTTSKWIHTENERQQLEQERTEAELKNLKNQLNPHFLFNTLNNIYSLIAISPNQAQSAVLELSKLLRHGLYENKSHVPIEKELDFIHNYIELMRLRLAHHVQVEVNIPPHVCQGYQIAPLLFITLIENAFKHGTSANKSSFIKINMSERESGVIECHIENSYFPKDEKDKSGSGIGLKNLSRQLELIYPGKHSLKTECDHATYCSTLTIDLK